jgi:hypothetical protein
VYGAIANYLAHRDEVDEYLSRRSTDGRPAFYAKLAALLLLHPANFIVASSYTAVVGLRGGHGLAPGWSRANRDRANSRNAGFPP